MSLNRVSIIGHLGADPETRYTSAGAAVTNIRVAVSEKWKDKQGNPQEKTEWVSVTAFERLAEIMAEYLRKGSQVYVEGPMRTEKWEKDGVTRYSTKVHARSMQMLGSKSGAPKRSNDTPPKTDGFEDQDIPF